MKKLLKYGVILSATAVTLFSASQARAVSITDDLESRHTFYITSEWATGDHWSVSQNQNFSDLLGEMRTDFRIDSVNLEVFYVGGVRECDLPAGFGSEGGSPPTAGFSSQGSGSGHVSSHGGTGGGSSFGSRDRDRDCDPEKESCSDDSYGGNDPQDTWTEGPGWNPPHDSPWLPPVYGGPYCPPHHDHGPAPVPEPATLLLMGGGLAILAGRRLRRKQPQA